MRTFITRMTVKGVELVKTGRWNGLRGPVELTTQDLEDALAASRDPEVDHAVVKLGHVDPRFDGQPAAGWVQNLRLSEDKATLLGDLVDMPQQLAGMLSDAYRRRSAELRRGVTTPSGRTYGTVLSGLALLGVQAPAVKGLSDVLAQYASERPGHEDDATDTSTDTITLADGDTPPVPQDPPAPSDAGGVDAPEGAGPDPTGEESLMDEKLMERLRVHLGLPDDADEAAIRAALETDPEGGDDGEGGEDQQDGPAGAPQGTVPVGDTPDPAQAGQAQAALGETVTVPRTTWERMTKTVEDLSAAEQSRQTEALLSEALRAGKLTPPEVQSWREALSDEARRPGAEHLLSTMPTRVAVVELGDGALTGTAETYDEKAWADQADALGL